MRIIKKALQERRLTDYVYLLCVGIAALTYVGHGVPALTVSPKYLPIAEFVGLKAPLSHIALILVGIIDLSIAGLLIARPRKWILLYASLWPVVPLYFEYRVTGEFEIVGKLILWAALALIYLLKKKELK